MAQADIAQRAGWVDSLKAFDRREAAAAAGRAVIVTIAILVPIVAYPSLIFSGPLQPYAGTGVGLGLISAVILTLCLVARGSFAGSVAVAQSEPAVILGVIAAVLAADLTAAGRPEQLLPAIFAMVVTGSATIGIAYTLLGTLRLGNVIRFIPYPVVVGFIGGMGWLLISGAFRVMVGTPLEPGTLPQLAAGEAMTHWLPSVALGLGLFALQMKRPHNLNVPAFAIASIAGFWVIALIIGLDRETLTAGNWLLDIIPEHGLWPPASRFGALLAADWSVVLAQWPKFATLVVVALMAVLMQASVIEIIGSTDIDLNRELRVVGVGNLLSTALVSLPGYHSLSVTTLAIRLGRPSRLVGLIVALFCALLLAVGGNTIGYLPRLTIGMLLIYVGLDQLHRAVFNIHLRRSWAEFGVAALVFSSVAFVGLIEGLGVGIFAGIVLFVVQYSRVDVVRASSTLATRASNVQRPTAFRDALLSRADEVFVLELQGHLFFGRMNSLLTRLRQRLGDAGRPPLRSLVLDFRHVTGIDASVSMSLAKLCQYADRDGFEIILSGLTADLAKDLSRLEQGKGAEMASLRFIVDLDHGLEHCEDRLLERAGLKPHEFTQTLEEDLCRFGANPKVIAALMPYVEKRQWPAGSRLIAQGDPSDDLYCIESGAVSVRLQISEERSLRIRTMGAGTVVGELAFYLGQPRAASVVAEMPTVTAGISRHALAAMQCEAPEAAALVHQYLARTLAEKLIDTTRMVAVEKS
ncbi:MAG: SulP family inorganic anion transporter [Rhodospirillales bacterium]|nr:SulP family inorganic anion transporter [Rhodospirillales bacterium]